jgi:hypothetical protein
MFSGRGPDSKQFRSLRMMSNQATPLQILIEVFEAVVKISVGLFKILLPAARVLDHDSQLIYCGEVGLEMSEVVGGLQVLERNGKALVFTVRV